MALTDKQYNIKNRENISNAPRGVKLRQVSNYGMYYSNLPLESPHSRMTKGRTGEEKGEENTQKLVKIGIMQMGASGV